MADEPVPNEDTPETQPPAPTDAPPEPDETPEQRNEKRIEGMSKALQKVTQDIAQLAKHASKQGGELTAEQELKRQRAVEESIRLRKEIESYAEVDDGMDGIDKKLSKAVLEQNRRLERLEEENRNLRTQFEKNRRDSDQPWDAVKAEYPNLDLRTAKAEWTKCVQQAEKTRTVKNAETRLAAGAIDQATFDSIVEFAAQDIFHPWAKSQNDAKKPPTATAPPPPPASGRRSVPIPAAQQHTPAIDSDPEMDEIRRISQNMDKESGGRVTV